MEFHPTWLKRHTARVYYRLLRKLSSVDIPSAAGDFRLAGRRVIEAFRAMPERNRFVRGMFAWLGFRQIAVEYAAPARFAAAPQPGPATVRSSEISGP